MYNYKEPTTTANDYVVLNLRINDTKLAQALYYGQRWVVEVWKNKDRLFQQAYPGKTINKNLIILYRTCNCF